MKKTHFLLPPIYQNIGWFILLPSLAFGLYCLNAPLSLSFLTVTNPFQLQSEQSVFYATTINLTLTLSALATLLAALFIAFSREAIEDEYIQSLRLQSWIWGVLVSHVLLLIGILLFYGIHFMEFLTYNMFSTLFIFIAHFRYSLYRFYRSGHEKQP